MKIIITAINLMLLFSISGYGQKNKTEPQIVDGAGNSSPKSSKNGDKKNDSAALQSGVSLEGELQKTLDVKTAGVGDEVILKVTKSIKQNGEVIVPKGSKLIGKVTEVQEKTKGNGMSKIGIVFDQIQGKNLNAPLNASIVSITQAASSANLGGGIIDSDVSGSSKTSANSSGGGGLLSGVGNSVGGVLNTTKNTVGGVTGTAGQTLGKTSETLGSAVNGIRLTQSADASAQGSTTLSSQGKNVRLEKGVVFGIRLNESVEYK